MFIFQLYIFFVGMSVQVIAHFVIGLFIYFLLSFKTSLCILDNSPHEIGLLQIFLPVYGVFYSLDVENFYFFPNFIYYNQRPQ